MTDHHDFTAVRYVRDAANNKTKNGRLIVFPGIEITCDDHLQCIALFEPESNEEVWNLLFGGIIKTSGGDGPDKNAEKGPQIDHNASGSTFADVADFFQKNPILSTNALLLPHVGKKGSHKSALSKGLGYRLSKFPVFAGYCEHQFSEYSRGDLDKLSGKDPAWSARPVAIFSTGDNRAADGVNLAANPVWVRLAEASIEGLRQVALARHARIRYEEPNKPAFFIEKMSVSSTLTGQNFETSFNDGFNAIIGGRGSGKTSAVTHSGDSRGSRYAVASLHEPNDTREPFRRRSSPS